MASDFNIEGVAIAGDVHLCPQAWLYRPELNGDSYVALQQIIDYCIKNRRALILAGDILDSKKPCPQDISVLRSCIGQMKSENLPVFFIDGNHDNANPSWISAISDYSINLDLHPVTLFDNISLSGVKYRSKSDLQETISNMVPTKYVVMHQMAKRVCSFAGVANFDLDWLPDGVEGCFLGDYHLPVEFSNDKVKAWYTGSMHVISIDEEKKKSFIDATPNDKGTLDVARIPLKGREYHSITIKSNKDLDAIIEAGSLKEIKASRGPVGMPVLVVNISTNEEIAGLKERVSSAVTENVYLWYNINTMKRLEDVTDSRDTQNTRMPMIHYIGEFADEKSSVGTLTKRLLEASDDTEADKLIKSYKSSLSI